MERSIRYSKKREAILAAIQGTSCHPSAEWIYQQLKPSHPDLSLGTVYRNLIFFQERGDIRSVGVIQGQERFDAVVTPHSHFVCEYCGAVIDLPHLTLDSVRKLIRAAVSREQSAFSGPLAEECSRWETLSLRCGSTPGNPCMFRADLIPELMILTGDQGGRKVLKRHYCQYVDISDEKELADMDEPGFLKKI